MIQRKHLRNACVLLLTAIPLLLNGCEETKPYPGAVNGLGPASATPPASVANHNEGASTAPLSETENTQDESASQLIGTFYSADGEHTYHLIYSVITAEIFSGWDQAVPEEVLEQFSSIKQQDSGLILTINIRNEDVPEDEVQEQLALISDLEIVSHLNDEDRILVAYFDQAFQDPGVDQSDEGDFVYYRLPEIGEEKQVKVGFNLTADEVEQELYLVCGSKALMLKPDMAG